MAVCRHSPVPGEMGWPGIHFPSTKIDRSTSVHPEAWKRLSPWGGQLFINIFFLIFCSGMNMNEESKENKHEY